MSFSGSAKLFENIQYIERYIDIYRRIPLQKYVHHACMCRTCVHAHIETCIHTQSIMHACIQIERYVTFISYFTCSFNEGLKFTGCIQFLFELNPSNSIHQECFVNIQFDAKPYVILPNIRTISIFVNQQREKKYKHGTIYFIKLRYVP